MKRLKRVAKRLPLVILVLVLISFIVGLFMAKFIMTGKRQTLDEAMKWQSEHYDTSFYESLEKTDYTVKSYDGYLLHVQFLKNPQPTERYIIISHGYTDNRMGALKYVPMYLDLGFNCVIYDLRGHGENESTFTSYGIREGQDIAELVKDTRSRYPDIAQLGLHGESLGAASTAASMKYKPQVDFAVCDCGFSDIENVLRRGYKAANVPTFLLGFADLGARVRYHVSIKDMRPIDSLDDNTVPMLFIHGAEDELITPENSEDMAARTKGISEVHLIEGAAHAESILKDPESYRTYVEGYLSGL